MFTKIFTTALLFTAFFTAFGEKTFAQSNKIDLNALVQETQKESESSDEMTLVWWIPESFWKVSLEQDKEITPKQTEEFVKILRPYIVVVVVDGKIGTLGSVAYKSESAIKNNIQIIDLQGNSYRPLTDDKIAGDAKTILQMMKPIFVNMLGAIGQNMHFVLFPSKNAKSENIINVLKEGGFSVKLDNRNFKWKLPLSSLVPRKICPVDGELQNGAWKYCPWHGSELKAQ